MTRIGYLGKVSLTWGVQAVALGHHGVPRQGSFEDLVKCKGLRVL